MEHRSPADCVLDVVVVVPPLPPLGTVGGVPAAVEPPETGGGEACSMFLDPAHSMNVPFRIRDEIYDAQE